MTDRDRDRLRQLQGHVGQWARHNFGDNVSKLTGHVLHGHALGSLAPLLGIVEEVGEMCHADNDAELRDAVGDVAIYLCDYAEREGFPLWEIDPEPRSGWDQSGWDLDAIRATAAMVGTLVHVTLKAHQGIRGFDDPEFYAERRAVAVAGILSYLDSLCVTRFAESFVDVVAGVWRDVVSARDWQANSETGGEP